ncbi:MAG: hypothetical protein HGB19_12040 [Chlorobiales bacterium]|nr:hypothetical protein [Chlorobiales bacterium]
MAQTSSNVNNKLNPIFKLWAIDYELPIGGLTSTVITNRENAVSDLEKRKWANLLCLFHAVNIPQQEGMDVKAKAELIKIGEHTIISSDYVKMLEQAEKSFKQLELRLSSTIDAQTTLESQTDPAILEALRATAYFLSIPLSSSLATRLLDVTISLIRNKSIPADLAYFLLHSIYKGLGDPHFKKSLDAIGAEFWEYFAGLAFKVMSRFLHDGTMEYILYYELPPGIHNDIHLKRCQLFLDVALQCCEVVRYTYPMIKYQLDQHLYSFCVDALEQQDPHPIINYSYRLLDFSSEDFFITLPKDKINKYIKDSITRLESM